MESLASKQMEKGHEEKKVWFWGLSFEGLKHRVGLIIFHVNHDGDPPLKLSQMGKLTNGFQENMVTVRTDEWTNGTEFIGPCRNQ